MRHICMVIGLLRLIGSQAHNLKDGLHGSAFNSSRMVLIHATIRGVRRLEERSTPRTGERRCCGVSKVLDEIKIIRIEMENEYKYQNF